MQDTEYFLGLWPSKAMLRGRLAAVLIVLCAPWAHAGSKPVTSADIPRICRESTAKNYDKNVGLNYSSAPYRYSLSLDQGTRLHGYEVQKYDIALLFTVDWANQPPAYQSGHSERFDVHVKEILGFEKKYIDAGQIRIRSSYDDGEKLRRVGPLFSCGLSGNEDCKKASLSAIEMMGTKSVIVKKEQQLAAWPVSLLTEFREVMTDAAFIVPINNLKAKLARKADQLKPGTNNDVGDLFTDVNSVFREYGYSATQSEEYAWKVLGVYATRGASMYPLFVLADSENIFVIAHLAEVASLISYLDGATRDSGRPYSMPPGVKSVCDYTRPYHFWLAAYLSHRLSQQHFAAKDVFRAVHGLEVIYEQFGATATKEETHRASKDKIHDAYVIETQKNIVSSSVGAYWALSREEHRSAPTVDWDDLLLKSYLASSKSSDNESNFEKTLLAGLSPVIQGVTVYNAATVFRWKQRFAPDVASDELLGLIK